MNTDPELLRLALMRVNAEDLSAESEAIQVVLAKEDGPEGHDWSRLHTKGEVLKEKAAILVKRLEAAEEEAGRSPTIG